MGADIIIKELEDGVPDKDPQSPCRWERVIFRIVQGIFLQSPLVGVFQHGGVESFFIPKVVIYRREIGASPAADFPDGGLAVAPGGKDLAGGFQEALPGVGIVCRVPFSICRFQFTVFRY
jgi:hypothetical protein